MMLRPNPCVHVRIIFTARALPIHPEYKKRELNLGTRLRRPRYRYLTTTTLLSRALACHKKRTDPMNKS